ncbi:MAG: hypothetical protein ABUS79_10355 [Pseudomonadota bacterium]
MKLKLMALGLVMAAGCAHGTGTRSAAADRRGSARLGVGERKLLAGPAQTVHASVDGEHPVSLFLVDRVHGDQRDCQKAGDVQSVAQNAHIEVGPGRELCATSTGGTAFVLWHTFEWERPSLWALQ